MSAQLLDTPIEYLKGVGPKRAELLKAELNIFTFIDLLSHYPFRYVDRSKFHSIRDVNPSMSFVQLKGHITRIEEVGIKRAKRLIATFTDGTGSVELVWFKGIKWIKSSLKADQQYILFGRPNYFKRKLNIPHPELDLVSEQKKGVMGTLQPIYSSTEKLNYRGLNSRGIERLQLALSQQVKGSLPETLSDVLMQAMKLPAKGQAVETVHFPTDQQSLEKAQLRLKFEELFFIQLALLKLKLTRNQEIKGFVFKEVGQLFNSFYKEKLPFDLTGAQKRVIKEIRRDLGSGIQMNRLLQGDVGSGKTVVALLVMLIALDNGYQAALMAPTEILANQHFETISRMLAGMDIGVGLLTGSSRQAHRKELLAQLQNGEIQVLIGTHALIEGKVQFANLGLVVIDEQHRFGVAQRAALWKKGRAVPHVLVMTATPIPRTLAMTLYGDLDVSVIDELPPGRKPVKTVHRFDSSRLRVFGFMKEQIAKHMQVYVVYPLIQESEKMDYKDLMDGYESICREFPREQYQVSIVHGKMKSVDKDYEMQRFTDQETQILVATTVIEVGVDIPNASVMVIESAERFGLSQLHQLRGRVGRGAEQSYCILISGNKLTEDAKLRMETMVKTNDGFKIAEVDLKLRGPGDLLGTQQSGLLALKIADLARDGQILQLARDLAGKLLDEDSELQNAANANIRKHFNSLQKGRQHWSRIS